MSTENSSDNAEKIRDVIRYIKRFKNATVVIYIDDRLIDSPLFSSHISDIALMHEAGLNVLIVPGAKMRIDEVLQTANISWTYKNGLRITSDEAVPLIKMAAFDVSNKIMTSLSGHGITALIGNWVRSRSKGVIEGIDYGNCGEIEKISVDAVKTVLSDGFIPIFPCIGWSVNGKPYNISSVKLACEAAIALGAEKLFFLTYDSVLNAENFEIHNELPLTPENNIPALNLEELDLFIKANEKKDLPELALLACAKDACRRGVSRVHILNGSVDGAMPCEIFSGLGSGTMIYKNDYGGIRSMQIDDIPRVLGVMRPFIERGILLPRTEVELNEHRDEFIVYELDGGIRACAALIRYPSNENEIAAVAVDETYSHMGIGPKMVSYLVDKSRAQKADSVFILTTQTSDWFEKLGFAPDSVEMLPDERRAKWSPERGSKVYRLML
ncbi:MAG: amino-acid N-acetyltransferase [Treponemataceae bacterium]|nr:amino-acid N-acetyltransferase [Treponemataceae bacterium]